MVCIGNYSQALKDPEKVPSKCPKCTGSLFCPTCNENPLHRRYPIEAIRQIIERVHPSKPDEVFNALHLIRNTLMHGSRIASVLAQLPCDERQAVNKLAFIVWEAIALMFDKPDPSPDTPFTFGHVDGVVRRRLIGGVHIKIGWPGDPQNPQISDFPKVEISLEHSPQQSNP